VADLKTSRNSDARALSVVGASIIGPILLTYALIATDMRMDLSELKPRQTTSENGDAPVGWANLAAGCRRNGPVRMLGYMMDGYPAVRDGTPVTTFLLMPEAGHLLHPAQRIPGKMVDIRLAQGQSLPFRNRSLVWVAGVLRKNGGVNYAMAEALARPAEERDITRWFNP
jgi:hypothetical protein